MFDKKKIDGILFSELRVNNFKRKAGYFYKEYVDLFQMVKIRR